MALSRVFSFVNQEYSKLEQLKSKRESFRTRLFFMMIEIAFVFAIPAAAAVFVGKKLETAYPSNTNITAFLLVGTFIISWTVVIFRFRRASRALKNISADIEREKGKGVADEPIGEDGVL
jgi:uncharacterized membrane protein (DUF485 family)